MQSALHQGQPSQTESQQVDISQHGLDDSSAECVTDRVANECQRLAQINQEQETALEEMQEIMAEAEHEHQQQLEALKSEHE